MSDLDSEALIKVSNLRSSPLIARLKTKTIFEDTETIFLATIAVKAETGGGSLRFHLPTA